jgi:hypothetical protein
LSIAKGNTHTKKNNVRLGHCILSSPIIHISYCHILLFSLSFEHFIISYSYPHSYIHTYILDILFSYKDWLFHFFWVCLLGPLITTKIAFLFVFVFGCFMVSLFFVPILNLCTFFSYNIFLFCSILLN